MLSPCFFLFSVHVHILRSMVKIVRQYVYKAKSSLIFKSLGSLIKIKIVLIRLFLYQQRLDFIKHIHALFYYLRTIIIIS